MLNFLHLRNVGPAAEMRMDLAPRLNLITGDNGLGKSFLLNVAWWALSRKWPQDLNADLASGYAARPTHLGKKAAIKFGVMRKSRSVTYESVYVPGEQAWQGCAGRPWHPGLVLYARADGGFAVWDPARNSWKTKGAVDIQNRVPAYVFSPKQVWDGLRHPIDGKLLQVSNGLVFDWASWIRAGGDANARMGAVLKLLASAVGMEGLTVGKDFARLSINDVRDIPTVHMNYGQDVPILHAALGVRRIVAFAYMLSWAWHEHVIASEQLAQKPSSQVVLLVDELEAHLHPRGQRAMISALLEVVQTLTNDAKATVQLIAATHSPLVLASVEPLFHPARDAWFDLDLEDSNAVLRKRPFVRHGEVGNWLTSEAFDLLEPRSLEAEEAIRQARAVVKKTAPSKAEVERVDALLRGVLGDIDPFWVRWSAFRESLKKRQTA